MLNVLLWSGVLAQHDAVSWGLNVMLWSGVLAQQASVSWDAQFSDTILVLNLGRRGVRHIEDL